MDTCKWTVSEAVNQGKTSIQDATAFYNCDVRDVFYSDEDYNSPVEYFTGKKDSSGTTRLDAVRTRVKYMGVIHPSFVKYAELVLYLSNQLVETVVNDVVSEDLPSLWKSILKITMYMK